MRSQSLEKNQWRILKKGSTDIKAEIINLKEVILKNLQNENKRLNDVVNQLQEKIVGLESKSNSDEQHGRRNIMEINGIPNSISDDNLEFNCYQCTS